MLHWKSDLLPRLKVLSTKGSAQFVEKYHLVRLNVAIGRKKLHCKVQTTSSSWFFTYFLLIHKTSLCPQTIHVFHDVQNHAEKQKCENNKRISGQQDFNFFGEERLLLYACVVCSCTWCWSQIRVGMWTFRHSLTLLRFFSSLFSLSCLLVQTFE